MRKALSCVVTSEHAWVKSAGDAEGSIRTVSFVFLVAIAVVEITVDVVVMVQRAVASRRDHKEPANAVTLVSLLQVAPFSVTRRQFALWHTAPNVRTSECNEYQL